MITVCIFKLRATMRTVQKSFMIPAYGVKHTVPDISKELETLCEALADKKVQEFVLDRKANFEKLGVHHRDLFYEGSRYAHGRNAFRRFKRSAFQPKNMGPDYKQETQSEDEEAEVDEGGQDEDYEATREDLEMDPDEPYGMAEQMVDQAMELFDDFEV
jgi:hypothetical protein